MKKFTLAVITAFLCITAQAQKEIRIEDITSHVGDSVTVCAKVYGGIYLDRSNLTLLNVGGAYPNAPLTLVIRQREKFKEAPETFYKDKEVCITGKIVLYKEKPQIELYEERQIAVK
ncbi:MAG: hypothetical protein HOP10_01990 [Chitinophagaceae bacterium]|nr:hypothetical protein [Chitinophagaceae bacterium]